MITGDGITKNDINKKRCYKTIEINNGDIKMLFQQINLFMYFSVNGGFNLKKCGTAFHKS